MDLLAIPEIVEFGYVLNSEYVAIRPCAGLSLTGITIVSLMEKLIWLQNLNCHGLIFFESFIQKIKQTTSQRFPIILEWILKIGSKNASLEEFQGTILSTEFITEINNLCTNFGPEATQSIKQNSIDLLYLSKELNIAIWLYDVKSHFEIKNNPFSSPILLTLMQIEKSDGLEVSILYHASQSLDTYPEKIEWPYALHTEDGKGDQSNLIDNSSSSHVLKSFIKKITSYMQDNAVVSEESCERINGQLKMLKSCMKRKWEFEDDLKKLVEKSKKSPERPQEKGYNVLPGKELKADNKQVEKAPEKPKKTNAEVEPRRNKHSEEGKINEFVEPVKKELPKNNIKPERVEKAPEIPNKKDVDRVPENTAWGKVDQFFEPAINQQVAPKNVVCSFCQTDFALNAISLACECNLCITCLRSGANYSKCPNCQRELLDSELDSIIAFITSIF